MHVDRGRFLLLTASIAAGSCGAQPGAKAPVQAGSADTITVAPTPITIAEPPDELLTVSEPIEPPSRTGTNGEDHSEGEDLKAACRAITPPPGPQCESFSSTVQECQVYADALRPEPAARATHCLTTLSGSPLICDFSASGKCLLIGVLVADPKPEADRPCASVMRRCAGSRRSRPDLSAATCRRAVSAVKPSRRSALLSCMSETCSIANCIYDLDPSR